MELNQVQLRAVALVLAETILGELRTELTHYRIARDLGNDTGGSNAETETISIDNRGLRQWKRNHRQTVDQHVIGGRA
jgi:hypothetical protein